MRPDGDPRLCPLAWRPRLTWLVARKAAGATADAAWGRCREVAPLAEGARCFAQVRACADGGAP